MQATHSVEYFEKYQKHLFEKYHRDCDFEKDLSLLLPDFSTLPDQVREQAVKITTKMYAQKVADKATEELKKKMAVIKSIRDGKSGLGFISLTQEVREWHDMNEGFEFSCWMLSQFKTKYNIK